MIERRWAGWLRIAGDMALAVAIYYLAFWLRINVALPYTEKLLPIDNYDRLPHIWWMVAVIQYAMLYFSGAYDTESPVTSTAARPIATAVTLTTLLMIAIYFFANIKFPRTVFLIFFAFDLLALVVWQWVTFRLSIPPKRQRAILVGVNETSAALLREIQRRPFLGLDIVGLVHEEDLPVLAGAGPAPTALPEEFTVLGTRHDLPRIIAEHRIDHVILTPMPSWQDKLIDDLGEMQGRRARVTLVPSPFEIIIGKPQQRRVHDIPLIDFLREPMDPSSRFLKRGMDLIGACLLFAMTAPVLLITAAVIKAVSPGPIFYRQVRVGRGGRLFSILKFRTMVLNAEQITGAVLAQKNDPRIYPFGNFMRKSRIDELPQLLNIFSGDMSFVGPRPERPEFVSQFRKEIPGYAERLRVKPGVTGLAQVNGFYETTPENKLKFDLSYIYNYSVFLDLRILLATIKVVLTGRGT